MISQSKEQVQNTKQQIETVLFRLNSMQRSAEQEQAQIKEELDALVRDASP